MEFIILLKAEFTTVQKRNPIKKIKFVLMKLKLLLFEEIKKPRKRITPTKPKRNIMMKMEPSVMILLFIMYESETPNNKFSDNIFNARL